MTEWIQQRNGAYESGMEAARIGLEVGDNPFDPGSSQTDECLWMAWLEGFKKETIRLRHQ